MRIPRSIIALTVLTLLTLSGFIDTAEAQTGLITGVVRDINGDPITDATVIGENSDWQRRVEVDTDGGGRFSFVGLQTGRWLFVVQRRGYSPVQGFAYISASGNDGLVTFAMEADPLHPPAPSTGVLANLRADELQEALDAADALFEGGNYDGAIEAYEAVLSTVPRLTSLNLQIGHAYRGKNDFERALAAYRAVPANGPIGAKAQEAIDVLPDRPTNR